MAWVSSLRSSSSSRASGRTWCSGRWLGVARLVSAATVSSSRAAASAVPAAGSTVAVAAARDELTVAADTSRATPSHLPLHPVRPDARLLDEERKLLTHAIRIAAYNAESTLARMLRPHYSRADDEARALL